MNTDNNKPSNSAPFKPQDQYVDSLIQRVTDNALQQARPAAVKPAWRRPLAAAAAAAAAVAIVLSLYLFNPAATRPEGQKLASVSVSDLTPPQAERDVTTTETEQEPATDASTPAPVASATVAHHAAAVSRKVPEVDPVDSFLNSLDDDQLAAIDDSYIDEIPEY